MGSSTLIMDMAPTGINNALGAHGEADDTRSRCIVGFVAKHVQNYVVFLIGAKNEHVSTCCSIWMQSRQAAHLYF